MRLDIATATDDGTVAVGPTFLSFEIPETRNGLNTAFRLIFCFPWSYDDIVTIKTTTNLAQSQMLRMRELCNKVILRHSLILDNGVGFATLTQQQIRARIG